MMTEKDDALNKSRAAEIGYAFQDLTGFAARVDLENRIVAALTTARKEARAAAFRDAAKDVCVHCRQRALSHVAEVKGPNSAGNYVHKSKSVRADALCEATSIHARLRFEAVNRR